MGKTIVYIILLIFSINACKTKDVKNNNDSIKIEIEDSYKKGQTVNIKIVNISKEVLVLFNPTKKNLQKKVDNKWINLRILPCPCDAPCQAPPEKLELLEGKDVNLTWNQKESFCGEKMNNSKVRETIYKDVNKGLYRFIVTYRQNSKEKTIYKEFKIR